MKKHLILFDASCPLCCSAMDRVVRWDKKEIFLCAPLDGELAKSIQKSYPASEPSDSLILVENFYGGKKRMYMQGRGVMRIFWLLGGWWACLGWLSFLPFGLNWAYRLVARHRHILKK